MGSINSRKCGKRFKNSRNIRVLQKAEWKKYKQKSRLWIKNILFK